jgi:hypothetical protein
MSSACIGLQPYSVYITTGHYRSPIIPPQRRIALIQQSKHSLVKSYWIAKIITTICTYRDKCLATCLLPHVLGGILEYLLSPDDVYDIAIIALACTLMANKDLDKLFWLKLTGLLNVLPPSEL